MFYVDRSCVANLFQYHLAFNIFLRFPDLLLLKLCILKKRRYFRANFYSIASSLSMAKCGSTF